MPFSEALKSKVRKKAHLACCICTQKGVEVHHIVPQEDGGLDTEDNAAPLCPTCHEIYGANRTKQKFIRENRDMWFEICAKRYLSDPELLQEFRQYFNAAVTQSDLAGFRDEMMAYLRGQQLPPIPHRIGDQDEKGESITGCLLYELRGEKDSEVEIWIKEKDRPENSILLCRTPGWGGLRMHFSPDDDWIVVQDGGASMGVELTLFKRDSGASFHEHDADIGNKAMLMALELQNSVLTVQMMHHRYIRCLSWSRDSESILVQMNGYGNDANQSYGINWFGVYNLTVGQFSSDLSAMNKQAVEKLTRH